MRPSAPVSSFGRDMTVASTITDVSDDVRDAGRDAAAIKVLDAGRAAVVAIIAASQPQRSPYAMTLDCRDQDGDDVKCMVEQADATGVEILFVQNCRWVRGTFLQRTALDASRYAYYATGTTAGVIVVKSIAVSVVEKAAALMHAVSDALDVDRMEIVDWPTTKRFLCSEQISIGPFKRKNAEAAIVHAKSMSSRIENSGKSHAYKTRHKANVSALQGTFGQFERYAKALEQEERSLQRLQEKCRTLEMSLEDKYTGLVCSDGQVQMREKLDKRDLLSVTAGTQASKIKALAARMAPTEKYFSQRIHERVCIVKIDQPSDDALRSGKKSCYAVSWLGRSNRMKQVEKELMLFFVLWYIKSDLLKQDPTCTRFFLAGDFKLAHQDVAALLKRGVFESFHLLCDVAGASNHLCISNVAGLKIDVSEKIASLARQNLAYKPIIFRLLANGHNNATVNLDAEAGEQDRIALDDAQTAVATLTSVSSAAMATKCERSADKVMTLNCGKDSKFVSTALEQKAAINRTIQAAVRNDVGQIHIQETQWAECNFLREVGLDEAKFAYRATGKEAGILLVKSNTEVVAKKFMDFTSDVCVRLGLPCVPEISHVKRFPRFEVQSMPAVTADDVDEMIGRLDRSRQRREANIKQQRQVVEQIHSKSVSTNLMEEVNAAASNADKARLDRMTEWTRTRVKACYKNKQKTERKDIERIDAAKKKLASVKEQDHVEGSVHVSLNGMSTRDEIEMTQSEEIHGKHSDSEREARLSKLPKQLKREASDIDKYFRTRLQNRIAIARIDRSVAHGGTESYYAISWHGKHNGDTKAEKGMILFHVLRYVRDKLLKADDCSSFVLAGDYNFAVEEASRLLQEEFPEFYLRSDATRRAKKFHIDYLITNMATVGTGWVPPLPPRSDSKPIEALFDHQPIMFSLNPVTEPTLDAIKKRNAGISRELAARVFRPDAIAKWIAQDGAVEDL